jgi:hypothetical protein
VDLSSEDAADWIVGGVKKDQYRILVGYDAHLIDWMVRVFQTKVYSFYEQFGKEGLTVDLMDPEQKNLKVFSLGVFFRLLLAGLWTNVLFLWPMGLLRLRHSAAGRAMLCVLAAGGLFKMKRVLGV